MNYKTLSRFPLYLIFLISLLVLNTGCDKELDDMDDNTVMKKLSVQDEDLINSANNLSLQILKAEYQNNQNANYFFSPVSVSMALGMVYNVVGENEKSQILQTTGLEYLRGNEINKSYNELLSFLNTSKTHSNISYANSLWFSSDMDVNEDFRTKVMAYYDAEIEELNFNKNSAAETVNHWGSMKTLGRFEKITDSSLPQNSNVLLINAFGLNTSWNSAYNSFISENPFENNKGEISKVPTINFDGIDMTANENNDFSFYEFPFDDKTYYLSLVVPQEVKTVSELLQSFSMEELTNLRDNAYALKANLSIPEIKFTGNEPMKSALSSIGLNTIFSETADLSPAFGVTTGRLNDLNQKAEIMLKRSIFIDGQKKNFSDFGLKQLNINKPFLYFVRDKYTKTVLFAGYYINPVN